MTTLPTAPHHPGGRINDAWETPDKRHPSGRCPPPIADGFPPPGHELRVSQTGRNDARCPMCHGFVALAHRNVRRRPRRLRHQFPDTTPLPILAPSRHADACDPTKRGGLRRPIRLKIRVCTFVSHMGEKPWSAGSASIKQPSTTADRELSVQVSVPYIPPFVRSSPMRFCQQYCSPVAVGQVLGRRHTHFSPHLLTTSNDNCPQMSGGENLGFRCGAMVSTTNGNYPQLSSPNQRVGGSIPSRRTISAGHPCRSGAPSGRAATHI
jgi:hypothetical protein